MLYWPLFAFKKRFRSRNSVDLQTCINFVNLVLADLVLFHSRSSTVVLVTWARMNVVISKSFIVFVTIAVAKDIN